MKSIIFDTSTVISLATNNLLWTIELLKKQFNGDFIIPKSVQSELVDYPLTTKKFKLEALVIKDYIEEGIFNLYSISPQIRATTDKLLFLANNIFISKNNPVRILSPGETETLALALHLKSDAIAIDERTMRLLLENPEILHQILEKKLNSKIIINNSNLEEFKNLTKGIKVIRSTELITIAYDLGVLDKYISAKQRINTSLRRPLLEGALWGLKLHGASISQAEIEEILRLRFGSNS